MKIIKPRINKTPTSNAGTPHGMIVPAGSCLIKGKLYLRLYHGRNDPDQSMDDWGFQGPVFGPLSAAVMTYLTTLRIYGINLADEEWIETSQDMVRWKDAYFGDFEIFIATGKDRA